ncbi:hypothetical protein GLOIN_2v1767227 [Rhizophagus irregularis DAOM 181602=DAOM 197198]|nr:hypothetical protein GLOIN_2v1767227 [Rhizophagus irregularis DAOM 181602=DAOM 197198]
MLSENIVEDKQQVDKLHQTHNSSIYIGWLRKTNLTKGSTKSFKKALPVNITFGDFVKVDNIKTITNNSKKTVSEAEKIATKLASQTFQVTKKQKKNLPIVVIDYDSTDKMQHNLLDQERQDQEHQDQEQEHRITRDVGDTSVTQTQNEETSFWQIVEGIKNCLAQNKEIF